MAHLICTVGGRRIRFYAVELTEEPQIGNTLKTAKCTKENYVAIPFGLIDFKANDTYQIDVIFRTQGNGDVSPTRCSSVGFVARRPDDGSVVYSIIDNSATAFARRKFKRHLVRTFTASKSEQLEAFLCFSVDGSPEKADGQTIEVHQCIFSNITHNNTHYSKKMNTLFVKKGEFNIRIGERCFVTDRPSKHFTYNLRVRRFSNPDIYYDVPGKPV